MLCLLTLPKKILHHAAQPATALRGLLVAVGRPAIRLVMGRVPLGRMLVVVLVAREAVLDLVGDDGADHSTGHGAELAAHELPADVAAGRTATDCGEETSLAVLAELGVRTRGSLVVRRAVLISALVLLIVGLLLGIRGGRVVGLGA